MENTNLPETTGSINTVPAEGTKAAATEDQLAILKEKDEKIAKLSQDRDNYRAGMLKYKSEAEQDPENKELEEDKIRQIFKEELLNTDLAKALKEKDEYVQRIARENSELKIAMANKSQISNMPGGSSQSQDVKVEELTDEQKAHFERISKEIGVPIDPKKFLENWKKSQLK